MTAVLEARGLTRRFGQVTALDGADFDVEAGEVVALIGDNGAGKSTLVKALSGNLEVDSGEILFDGRPTEISTPMVASSLGIETVYQDLALAPHLDPVQNMYLGREIMRPGLAGKLGFMDNKAMRAEARTAFDRLGATVRSLISPIGSMSGGQRQAVAIARAVHWANRVVFLDEPTAALGVRQTANGCTAAGAARSRESVPAADIASVRTGSVRTTSSKPARFIARCEPPEGTSETPDPLRPGVPTPRVRRAPATHPSYTCPSRARRSARHETLVGTIRGG